MSNIYIYMCIEYESKCHRAATPLMLDFSVGRTCEPPVLMNIMKQFWLQSHSKYLAEQPALHYSHSVGQKLFTSRFLNTFDTSAFFLTYHRKRPWKTVQISPNRGVCQHPFATASKMSCSRDTSKSPRETSTSCFLVSQSPTSTSLMGFVSYLTTGACWADFNNLCMEK